VLDLDHRSGVPLYMQVEGSLRRRITSGEWAAGEQIPTEDKLCTAYGVSRITVRQAMSKLIADGLVVQERGRGRFVRDKSLVARERGVTSFTDELLEMGLKPGSVVLERRVLRAEKAGVVEVLRLEPHDFVVRWKRLRTADNEPMGLQTSILPLRRLPGLEEIDLDGRSLYSVLFEHYGLLGVEAVDTYTVSTVGSGDAKLLKVATGSPAFMVERLTSATEGPVEYTRSVMRGDRYRVRLTLGSGHAHALAPGTMGSAHADEDARRPSDPRS
jgi:GntR family transcriptional regulator